MYSLAQHPHLASCIVGRPSIIGWTLVSFSFACKQVTRAAALAAGGGRPAPPAPTRRAKSCAATRPSRTTCSRRERGRSSPSREHGAALGAHGVGEEHADAAAGVPAHRDRRRGGAARGGARRSRLGERRACRPTSTSGRRSLSIDLGGTGIEMDAARVGEQRADDVLLLRRRARGAARVRPRRAARASALGRADPGGDGRDARGGRDLPRLQRRTPVRARLGRRDVDRHRVRARRARARRASPPRPAAGASC